MHLVARVVARARSPSRTPYCSRASWQMTMLSSSSPVTATTMSGGRRMPARSRTNSSVASPSCTRCSNSSSRRSKRSRRCSISVTSWPARDAACARCSRRPCRRLRPGRTWLGGGSSLGPDLARPGCVDQHRDRVRGRADDAHAERRVELGAGRVEDADDDAADAEALLERPGRRRCSCCRRSSRRRRRRPPRCPPRGARSTSMPWPTTKPPLPVLAEADERLLLLVDGHDVPAVAVAALSRPRSRRGRSRSRSPSCSERS